MLEDLVDAMLNGGVNKGLHTFVNICFTLLFIFLLLLGAFWGLNIHVIFMLTLCAGLMLSINWYTVRAGMNRGRGLAALAKSLRISWHNPILQVCVGDDGSTGGGEIESKEGTA
jgi:hypothetical protein